MSRVLTLLSSTLLLAAMAKAQCPQANDAGLVPWDANLGYATTLPADDEGISPPIALPSPSQFGSSWLVGYTGPGAGIDPGSTTLPALLSPFTTVNNSSVPAMTLSAAPRPRITPSTTVTYTANDLPEAAPGSGLYLSTLFFSLTPLPGGFDLAGILTTVPGCNAWIGSLDLDHGANITNVPTASWTYTFDSSTFAPGDAIAAQAVALFDPTFPLGNGESGGFLFSNGVLSTVNLY